MKKSFLSLLTLQLVIQLTTSLSYAADNKAEAKKEVIYGNVTVNETLDKMLQVPGVKAIYDGCVKTHSSGNAAVPNCVWDKVSKNPDQKKAVQGIYALETSGKKSDKTSESSGGASGGASRSPAGETKPEKSLTAKILPVATDYSSDPAVVALSKFYEKKLDEILDPSKALSLEDQKAGKILSTDHRKFIDLYKSELGKTIINAFTSYCLDTDDTSCQKGGTCILSDVQSTREDNRKKNLENLKSNSLDLDSKGPQAAKWNYCITNVPKICDSQPTMSSPATQTEKDETYSKRRACLIVDYVKAARKNIMVADKQKEFYDEMNKTNGAGGGIAQNVHVITDENKLSADAVLSITSKDVENSLKDSEEYQLSKKEVEACYDDKTQKILNTDACKKFLNTDKDANEASLTELAMRQNIQSEELKVELDSSDKKIVSYLKEEGYKEEEIKKITDDKDSLQKIKDQIIARYKSEKEAIIQEMADRIKNKTSDAEGKIDANSDSGKMGEIRKAINNKSSELAGLVQFNNIVSSYLTIDSGNNKIERNTASLFAETKVMDTKDSKIVGEKITAAKLVDKKNNADLNVNTLNSSFLQYDEIKAKTPPKP